MDGERLRRLARWHGIEPGAPDEAQIAVLAALGVDASTPEALDAALTAHVAAAAERVLPPVVVWRGETAGRVPLHALPGRGVPPGRWRITTEDGQRREGCAEAPAGAALPAADGALERHELVLDVELPCGRHRLEWWPEGEAAAEPPADARSAWLVVAPSCAYRPAALDAGERIWGPELALAALRSERAWGGADLTTLAEQIALWAPHGAGAVAVEGLVLADEQGRTLHRGAIDWRWIDIESLPEWHAHPTLRAECERPEWSERLEALRRAPGAAGEAALKRPLLERLYLEVAASRLQDEADPGTQAFRRFCAERAEVLAALPQAPAAPPGIDAWLQWRASQQLAAAGTRSWERHLSLGLVVELPAEVGFDSPEAAAAPALRLAARAGGACWHPARLREEGYAPLVALLSPWLAPAGALRLADAGRWLRAYCVAAGGSQGAWLTLPIDEWCALLALLAERHRCALVAGGADALPEGFAERLAAEGWLLEYDARRERAADGVWLAPEQIAPSHALRIAPPSLAVWWEGRDLAAAPADREQAALRESAVIERSQERARLLLALERERLLPPHATANPISVPEVTPQFARACQTYLARSAAALVLVDPRDGGLAAPDGTLLPLERWAYDDAFVELVHALARARGAHAAALGGYRAAATVPRATYRVQLHRDFRLADATALVPYWAALGIGHLYTSPLLRARPGSSHGYDVVDHHALNPELGSDADLDALVAALRAHAMGLVVDIVPNHMGVHGSDNAWWLDVLECGPASAHAEYFDIDWRAADPALAGRVLLPILGDQYGVVLERGELQLAFDDAAGSFTLGYYQHRMPIDPSGYGALVRRAARAVPAREWSPGAAEAAARLAEVFDRLPARDDADPAARARRQHDKPIAKRQLAEHLRADPQLARALAGVVATLNGSGGGRSAYDALDALIDSQPWRLAYWRVAGDEINYRRFFDINDLAALRMERAEVFDATHRRVLEWVAAGVVDGLRIDHSDGLADPAAYFARLQSRVAEWRHASVDEVEAAPRTRPLWVVTEKITAPHETMPRDWALHGTTGYEFASLVNGLFVAPAAKARLGRVWRAFAGDEARDADELAWRCRHLVMAGSLAAELTVLATDLLRLAREDRRTRDFTLNLLRRALAEVAASFPVYRTYVVDKASLADRRHIDWAIGRARRRSRVADPSVFDFVRRVLIVRPLPGAPAGQAERMRRFVRRWQQYTSPVAAKGIEDTAFYRHQRLVSVNDVGGDPEAFGTSVAAFHAAGGERAAHWPHTMLASSTHDAKRSEDVRLRIDAISEMPAAWRLTVRRWSRLNRRHKRTVGGAPAPSKNDEYLLYQTLVGSLPAGVLDAEGWPLFIFL